MFTAKRVKGSHVEVAFELSDTDGHLCSRPYTTVSGLLTAIAWEVLMSKDPSVKETRFSHSFCELGPTIKVTFYNYRGDPPEMSI